MTLSAICAAFSRTQHNARRRPATVLAAFALLLAVFSGCGGSGTTTDTTPPTFAGVKSTSSQATSITISWSPASDNVTAPWDIVYLVYRSPTSGFTPSPTNLIATTARGALSFDDTPLITGSTFYYVVRAMDAAGNKDSNTKQIMGATDIIPLRLPLQYWRDERYSQCRCFHYRQLEYRHRQHYLVVRTWCT